LVLVLPVVLAAGVLATWPATAEAQRRWPVRSGHARVSVFVGGGYYYPYYPRVFYDGYWGAGYWGAYPWHPWGFYPQYPIYAGRWEATSSAKILVTPRETEVYVDGYFVGIADDFDGAFQSLHLPPGGYEIQLYLEGYRSVSRKIHLSAHSTYKLRHTMVPLQPGEAGDPKPVPTEPPEAAEPRAPQRPAEPGAPFEPRAPVGRRPPFEPRAPYEPRETRSAVAGTLVIRVQPGNAEVLIDGERWEGADAAGRLEVQVPEGVHRVDVQLEGYEPFSTEVRVRRGQTTPLNVSLPRLQPL
jgi:hypothetical protein